MTVRGMSTTGGGTQHPSAGPPERFEWVRRVGWRLWMVLRTPFRLINYAAMGLVVLVVVVPVAICCVLLAAVAGAVVAGGIGGLIALVVPGIEPDIDHAAVGMVLSTPAIAIFGIVKASKALGASYREESPWSRLRRWAEGVVTEWRDAADQWPSRRNRAPTPARGPDDDTPDVTDHAQDEPDPLPLQPTRRLHGVRHPVGKLPAARIRTAPIIAWRGWAIAFDAAGPFDRQPVLGSLGVPAKWDTAHLTAVCWLDVPRRHLPHAAVPDVGCGCGIYAVKLPDLIPSYDSDMSVFGPVVLHGRVLEYDLGYRAQHASILGPLDVTLRCGSPRCTRAPVAHLTTAEDDMPVCETHRWAYGNASVVDIDEFVVQLRARLELRYGADVHVTKGTHQWT